MFPGPATSTAYPPEARASSAPTGTTSALRAVAVVMFTVTGAWSRVPAAFGSVSVTSTGIVAAGLPPGPDVVATVPTADTTPGVVSAVGTVATRSGLGGSPAATIPVEVTLTDPKAAGTLDQAPVTVNITTATARSALVVPVGALLARASGGYAVEVVGTGNTRRYIPVTTGIFDDADGMVQVTGALAPGQRVVVPAS